MRHTKIQCVLPITHFSVCVDRRGLCPPAQAIVVFKIDKDEWTLDLRPGKGSLKKGPSEDKVNLTLTVNSANFVQLYVRGGWVGEQAFLEWRCQFAGGNRAADQTLTPAL